MSTLSCKNGYYSYAGSREILKGISYEVSSGELVAILGPNGAGKTTLLKNTMGLLSWTTGASYLDGKDIKSIPARQLFAKVSYVPQAKSGVPAYSVLDMVLLGRGSSIGTFSLPKKADIEIVRNCLRKLGISYLEEKKCNQISGGELQMVLIARALASHPEIIVLDEPESNLDFRNQLMVMNTLKMLRDENVACLFNTHFPVHALQYADKALILYKDGRSIFGKTKEIITEKNIESAFGVKAVLSRIDTEYGQVEDVIPLCLVN